MRSAVLCALFACSAPAPASPDASAAGDAGDAAPDAPFVVAPHANAPAMPSNGGAPLVNANLVVVTFANYTQVDDVEAMIDWLPSSNWLAAVGSEYGIGTPSVLAKVRLATSAPPFTSAADFTSWVIAEVGGDLPAPPSASTIYAFVFPSGATFTDASLGSMCDAFTGYHDTVAKLYAFAAIGTCPNHVPNLSDAEQVERVISHEMIEALTDPFGDGYAWRDPENAWTYVAGGEVADVCNGYAHEDGFLAVRSYSNASAAAGRDPCEPNDVDSPDVPFFATSTPDAKVAHVSAGSQWTIPLVAWSTAPTADWIADPVVTLDAFVPSIDFDQTALNSGATPSITIGVPASAASGSMAVIELRSLRPGDATYALAPIALRVD